MDPSLRRFPIGAEVFRGKGTHLRVWAPTRTNVEVVRRELGSRATGEPYALTKEKDGYFSGFVPAMHVGALYSFRLDSGSTVYPDPASRFQPEGPHGPSMVVEPSEYHWSDAGFAGPNTRGQVLYEMHIGTFTKAGTYEAAAAELRELHELGITTLELMPLADFPGRFGWGYDGVNLWAPTRLYGSPDELRRFVDRAHQCGLCVLLDVVYNHLGPDGNYLNAFSPYYFTNRYDTEWGDALDFDGPKSAAVREFFSQNARYWIEEYHFDGLRLDAAQCMYDSSERHVISKITEAARAGGKRLGKRVFIVAENEKQRAKIARRVEDGGDGCDAVWNDDFHHSARVAMTGRREAYYTDYQGTPQELISASRWGHLYQGQHYFWQKQRRGKPALDLECMAFVAYIQNHDQVANSLAGERIDALASAAIVRAMTALLLLGPSTPMLFQGQEFAASAPFLYFADQNAELRPLIGRGRRQFLAQFPSLALEEASDATPDPADPATFERCKLDFRERQSHHGVYRLHQDLISLRREPAFSQQRGDRVHGAVLSAQAFLLRFFCDRGDRLLVVNLGPDLQLVPAPEPLLAPPEGDDWKHVWSSDHPKYGGKGYMTSCDEGLWKMTSHSASVFSATAGGMRAGRLETSPSHRP